MAGYDPLTSIMNTLRKSNSIDPAQVQQRQSRMGNIRQQQGAQQQGQAKPPAQPPAQPQVRDELGATLAGVGAQNAQEVGQEGEVGVQGGDFTPIIIDQMNETIISLKIQIHRERDQKKKLSLERQADQIRQNVIALGGEPIWAEESVEEGMKKLQGHGYVGFEAIQENQAQRYGQEVPKFQVPSYGPDSFYPPVPSAGTAQTSGTVQPPVTTHAPKPEIPVQTSTSTQPVTTQPTSSSLLQKGSKGTAVFDLQNQLQTMGLYAGVIDGEFGPNTEQAVRALQAQLGVTVDGIVGPETLAAMQKKSGTPSAVTPYGADVDLNNQYKYLMSQLEKAEADGNDKLRKWVEGELKKFPQDWEPTKLKDDTIENVLDKIFDEEFDDDSGGIGGIIDGPEFEAPEFVVTDDFIQDVYNKLGIEFYDKAEIQQIAADLVARMKLGKSQAIKNEIARFEERHDHEFAKAKEKIMIAAQDMKADEQEAMIARGFYYSSTMANNLVNIDNRVLEHLTDIATEAAMHVAGLNRQLTDLEEWAVVEQIALERELQATDRADRKAFADLIISTRIEYDKLASENWYRESMIKLQDRQVNLEESRFTYDQYIQEGQWAAAALMVDQPLVSGMFSQLGLTRAAYDALDGPTKAGIVGNILQFMEIDSQLAMNDAQREAILTGIELDKELMSLRWDQLTLDEDRFEFEKDLEDKYSDPEKLSDTERGLIITLQGETSALVTAARAAQGAKKNERIQQLTMLQQDANLLFNTYTTLVDHPDAKRAVKDMQTAFNNAAKIGDTDTAVATISWLQKSINYLTSPDRWYRQNVPDALGVR